jgi:hypothetical protein
LSTGPRAAVHNAVDRFVLRLRATDGAIGAQRPLRIDWVSSVTWS